MKWCAFIRGSPRFDDEFSLLPTFSAFRQLSVALGNVGQDKQGDRPENLIGKLESDGTVAGFPTKFWVLRIFGSGRFCNLKPLPLLVCLPESVFYDFLPFFGLVRMQAVSRRCP